MTQSGGLLDQTLPDGRTVKLPALPIEMDGERLGVRRDMPDIAEHTAEILQDLGYSADEISALLDQNIIAVKDDP